MNPENFFAALSLISVYVYLHIGFYTLMQNKGSILNRVFCVLCFSYAVWAFAYSFAYLAENEKVFSFWNKFSAFGWCTYAALSLYLVLLLTENKLICNKAIVFFTFLPSFLFLFMALFLFGPDVETPPAISHFFYTGDFLYDFLYAVFCIYLLVHWGIKSDSLRVKKQSRLLVVSSSVPFLLNLLTQTILPAIGFDHFPLMGQLYAVIMIIGTYIVISKYKMLRIPRSIILDEVENKIIELVILLNEKGEFIQVSKHVLRLLNFEEADLLGKDIVYLFSEEDKEKFSISSLKQEKEYKDILIFKKGLKDTLPVQITSVPITDHILNEFLGALLVVRDISTEYELRAINAELHERTIRDSLTNLYNHQHSLEILNQEINLCRKKPGKQELTIMMLDIDHFKKVNDTYGHLYGDEVIKIVSAMISRLSDTLGYAGRFGGEEFIIILPETSLKEACPIGEKIRTEVSNYSYPQPMSVTVSIGIAQLEKETPMQLLKKADDLLYKAKQNGRNRIEC